MTLVKKINKNKSQPPVVLVILDGWGLAPAGPDNAISQAKTPTFDWLWQHCPKTTLHAHGKYVGLPSGQVGNSEAGHLNIGGGRIVEQEAVEISKAIANGTFFKNSAFLEAIHHVQQYKSQLHLMGILSGKQCPHMSPEHIISFSRLVKKYKLRLLFHFFADGRDAPPKAVLDFWQDLEARLQGNFQVASVSGRLYLDRKKKWTRTEKIYNALVLGKARYKAKNLTQAVKQAYARGETDEFIEPTLIRNSIVSPADNISDGDSVVFFNLRSDRARQLTKPFVQEQFEELNQDAFVRQKKLNNLKFVAMTDFGPELGPVLTAFPAKDIEETLPKVLAQGYKELYIAESEKYAHVTYFFNGGHSKAVAGENRILIKSKDVVSYDQVPAMSAPEVTNIVIKSLENNWYNFICLNFANSDMLGHTGNLEATALGCQIVDDNLAKILKLIKSQKGYLIVTADHGNAEDMSYVKKKNGIKPLRNTMHTDNPVPFIVFSPKKIKLKQDKKPVGCLADIAPTVLELSGLSPSKPMKGESLLN